MTRKSRRLRLLTGEKDALATVSSNTKLFVEDYEEVRQLCAGGKTESAVIRELVHMGLQRARYKKAASDPAMRELLRTFDEIMTHRLLQMELRLMQQLAIESDVVNQYFRKALPFLMYAGRALRAYLAGEEPTSDPEQLNKFYMNMAYQIVEEAKGVTEAIFNARKERSDEVATDRERDKEPEA
jgi:hypothetical protein